MSPTRPVTEYMAWTPWVVIFNFSMNLPSNSWGKSVMVFGPENCSVIAIRIGIRTLFGMGVL